MTTIDIAQYRLIQQQIVATTFTTPKDMVAWLGAVQAQDYNMALWAIGCRLPNATEAIIEQAIDDATVIRTHILRPTWHFVSADDIRWMLALTAPRIDRLVTSMYRNLGLDTKNLQRGDEIIAKALEGGKQMTRQELMLEIEKEGIAPNDLLMFHAELSGTVCNGSRRGKQFTYALLDERVPQSNPISREEALTALSKRYFTSHAPATVQDFAWWSGLSLTDAKAGLASVQSELHSETINGQIYWFPQTLLQSKLPTNAIHLLPAFDEFMISYKDRSASIKPQFAGKAFTNNGIFKPIIVADGEVIGIWKRTVKKDTVWIEASYFDTIHSLSTEMLSQIADSFGRFLGKKVCI